MIPVDKLSKDLRDKHADSELMAMLEGLETTMREYTNNHFHVRGVQFDGLSGGTKNLATSGAIGVRVGDRVELVDEHGVHTLAFVAKITPMGIAFDRELPVGALSCYLVRYPADVVLGVSRLLAWQSTQGSKIGIKAESIGRHSVTYGFDGGAGGMAGYPVELTAFLKSYMRART